jgi:hypothetical protein
LRFIGCSRVSSAWSRASWVCSSGRGLGLGLGEAGEGEAGEAGAVLEVAGGDGLAFGVVGEPAVAEAQELVDLLVADEVVLVVVEDGQEDVEVGEELAQGAGAGELDGPVGGHAPGGVVVVEGEALGGDGVTERLEEAAQEWFAAATGDAGQAGDERERELGELGALLADAGEGAAQDLGDGDAEERGGDVGAVVDVLREEAVGLVARAPADQADRVDLEEEGGGAGVVAELGVEDVRAAEGELEVLHAGGVLVQQPAEVARGAVGGADRQQHGDLASRRRWGPRARRRRRSGSPGCARRRRARAASS